MSKVKSNIPRAAIHVGAPAKSFSAAEGYEPERRGWDENTYRLKNQDTNNHYDFTRRHLNFEINGKGEIVPIGSNPIPLHERLKQRLDELGFKPYKEKGNPLGNSDNSPNCTVGIIVSGDHELLSRLAFGDQEVDFALQKSNAHVHLEQGIRDWAMDTYHWACDRWGAENIIGFDVHLDETTPHIHIQTIPVAKTKTRGRASVRYVHKDDSTKVLTHKEWNKLPEGNRSDFIRTEVERREKECVSYARVWGEDRYAVGKTYYQMHTDYYNKLGRKYGLERGEDIAMLPAEERRERVHKSKVVLEAERQAKESIAQSEQIAESNRQEAMRSRERAAQYESYADAIDIKQEDLAIPSLATDQLINSVWKSIQRELNIPIPPFKQKEWREERRKSIKQILTDMQTALFNAKEVQKKDVLRLGQSLYNKAMKDARTIVEQNKHLRHENLELTADNTYFKQRIASIDENAIAVLRDEKNEEIAELQKQLERANTDASRSNIIASRERQRADNAENQVKEMLAIPEIRQMWNIIQQNKQTFWQQINQWIDDAKAAIYNFAKDYEYSVFTKEYAEPISWGIVGQALKDGLDASDNGQRVSATNNLLGQISWKGTTDFMSDNAKRRTISLCEEMDVPKELMKGLLFAAGGHGSISTGGGGSNSELTNWDGTKKRNGWGI